MYPFQSTALNRSSKQQATKEQPHKKQHELVCIWQQFALAAYEPEPAQI
jgi:hypothetical protein